MISEEAARDFISYQAGLPTHELECRKCPNCKFAPMIQRGQDGWLLCDHNAECIKRCDEHAKPARPWIAQLAVKDVQAWFERMNEKHGDWAFEIDYDELHALLKTGSSRFEFL